MSFENGSRIGDYEIVAPLGAGGMGQVYKVRNLISDRVEAMKVLLPNLTSEPELADRFLREIKVQANLDHPNIAKLYTALRLDNQLLMFMEFVEGVSLDRRLREGPLPVPQAVDYVSQVLAALEYAHQHGIVHRDIKPANMMLTPAGVVKLMDFGIAKAATERGLTSTGMTLGSLFYMSPEQIQGSNVDPRSDLYSVGVSLYEMVTGKKPFEGTSQFSIMSAHLEKEPVPPIEIDKEISPVLNELIVLSLNRDPACRFQSAAAFRNALSSLRPESPKAAPAPAAPITPVAASAKPRSRRWLWMTAGGVAAVLAIVAIIQFGPRTRIKASPPAQPASQQAASPPPAAAPAQPAPSTPAPAPAPATQPVAPPAAETAPAPAPAAAHKAEKSQMKAQTPPAQTTPAPAQAVQPPPAAPPPTQAAPAQPPAASQAELEPLRDQYTQLDARAESIRGTLVNLQRSQAAQGYSLRGDWTQAATLMDAYLRQANSALGAEDAASAKTSLKKAERQIEFLEKALNK